MKAYWKYDYETRHAIVEALEAAEARLNRAATLASMSTLVTLSNEYADALDLVQTALQRIDDADTKDAA
jgi:hypothetical protein